MLLLLVPLMASAHHHAGDQASSPTCSICAVSHHAPAVPVAVSLAHGLTLLAVALPPLKLYSPTCRVHSPIAGRAPPSISSTLSVS